VEARRSVRIMGNGNGKRLVPGLQKYLYGSDFYRDPRWKALVRQERERIRGASSYKERDRLARERAEKKYFLSEEPS
jgi:hypothetical protein